MICNVGSNPNPNDDLGLPISVEQLPVREDDDSEQSDDSDFPSKEIEWTSDESLTFAEDIAQENIVHDVNHDDNEDSYAVDSWAQEENNNISYEIKLHDLRSQSCIILTLRCPFHRSG